MQYALLFYNQPSANAELMPPAQRDAFFGRMRTWIGELQSAGVLRSSLRLAPTGTAASLRSENGEVLVVDGPFAETKEILGGLIVVECASRADALAYARRCPIVEIGTVEVREEFPVQR